MARHGEIGHQQRSGRRPPAPRFAEQLGQRLPEQQSPQPLTAPFRFCRQGGEQRSVHATGVASRQPRQQQGGDIGEPQQPAGLPNNGPLQQPCRSPAPTGTGQQGRGLGQVVESLIIPTCQIPPAPIRHALLQGKQSPALKNR